MSDIKLQHASGLRSGSYIIIGGNPCIVRDTQTSRPGKHGHAKVRIKAVDMFSGSTKEIVKPGHDNVEVPIITKVNAQILSITKDDIELMNMESFENITAQKSFSDEKIKDKLAVGQTIMLWRVLGEYMPKQIVEEAH